MQRPRSLLAFFLPEGSLFRAFVKFYRSGSLGDSREEFRFQNSVVHTRHVRTILLSEVWPTVLRPPQQPVWLHRWMVLFCHGCKHLSEGRPPKVPPRAERQWCRCVCVIQLSFPSSCRALLFPSSPWPSRLAAMSIVLVLQRSLGKREGGNLPNGCFVI